MTSDNFTTWRKATYSHGNGNCVEVATTWRKSSYSHANGDCVELATARRVVGVRDTTQDGRGPVLEFPAATWMVFIGIAKS